MVENISKNIRIEKLTLNIGSGANQDAVEKAIVLLQKIANEKPVKSMAKKRIATWGIRPGLPIGAKVTVRGKKAKELLGRLVVAVEKKLNKSCFCENGFSFGVKEYIDIEGVKYDPKVPIGGLDVSVSLSRQGFRITKRKQKKAKISKRHKISAEDAIHFVEKEYGVTVE